MVTLAPNAPVSPTRAQRDAHEGHARAYRLFWRMRASGPWRREEFDSREEAFNRYFYLLGKGLDLRWRAV